MGSVKVDCERRGTTDIEPEGSQGEDDGWRSLSGLEKRGRGLLFGRVAFLSWRWTNQIKR